MHFYIRCVDKPGAIEIRKANRDAHLAYVKASYEDKIIAAGPTLDPATETMNGSVFLIDLPDMAAAEEMCANDPYAKAGLFESVVIRPWKMVFGG